MKPLLPLIAFAALFTAELRPQPSTPPIRDTLQLRARVAAPGQATPRYELPPLEDSRPDPRFVPVMWRDRRIEWLLGASKTPLRDRDAVRMKLESTYDDRASWVPDPRSPGQIKPAPVTLRADPDVAWGEVVAMMDMVMAAGFNEIYLEGVSTGYLIPRAGEPFLRGGELVLPICQYCEPDEPEFESDRSTVELLQNREVRVDSTPLTGTALHERLVALRSEAEEADAMRMFRPDEPPRIDRPVLFRADVWAAWVDVQQTLQLLTRADVGFWKLHLACAEENWEAQARAGERALKFEGPGKDGEPR